MGFTPISKRSKKAQKEYYSQKRNSWGLVKPYTTMVESKKIYNRKKVGLWE